MKITSEKYEIQSVAARMCDCPRQTLSAAIQRGAVPHVRLAGGTRVVALADVREWLNKPQSGRGRPRSASTDDD